MAGYATDSGTQRYPAGTGWVAGYILGVGFGILAWAMSNNVAIGVIILAATSPVLGMTIEQALDTRPLTDRQRRNVVILAGLGVVLGVIVLLSIVFYG